MRNIKVTSSTQTLIVRPKAFTSRDIITIPPITEVVTTNAGPVGPPGQIGPQGLVGPIGPIGLDGLVMGTEIDDSLTDLNHTWSATKISDIVNSTVETHRVSIEPHPEYDDLSSLTLIFENRLV